MASITQTIPNFFGGISEVPDSSNNTNMQPLSPDRNSALSQCTIGTPHPHFELHPGTASKLDANDDWKSQLISDEDYEF